MPSGAKALDEERPDPIAILRTQVMSSVLREVLAGEAGRAGLPEEVPAAGVQDTEFGQVERRVA